MQISDYVALLDRRKWVILLVTVLTVAGVAFGTYSMTPTYTASSLVRIVRVPDSSGAYAALNYTDRLITTYVQLLQGPTFMGEVISRLGLNVSPASLTRSVQVEAIPNTELLRVRAESANPVTAAQVANTLADLLVEEGQRIYVGPGRSAREILEEQLRAVEAGIAESRASLQALLSATGEGSSNEQIEELRARIRTQEQIYTMLLDQYDQARVREAMLANSISVVERASVPGSPSKPRVRLNLALGVLAGLGGGLGLAFVVDSLNRAIHSPENLEAATQAPLLGSIPAFATSRAQRDGPVMLQDEEPLLGHNTHNPAGEAFRMLRSVILSSPADAYDRPRTILVTSAAPGEGKSTIVANLALVMAQAGRRVIVVDSDLRRPSIHRAFALNNETGLSSVLLGRNVQEYGGLQETRTPGIRVLTSGPLPRYPAELLSSSNMQRLIDELATKADLVLFDSAPILAAADAVGIASMVDGVILVAARASATDRQIQKALQGLDKVGARVLGTVLNRAKPESGGYVYYYDPQPSLTKKASRAR